MDHQRDYDKFKRLVSRLCVTFDKFANDELLESWWKALRTADYTEVERRIEAFIANAGSTTRFPRPGQFRPESMGVAGDPKDEYRDKRIAEENSRNWRAFIAANPQMGPIYHQLAICARITATTPMESPAYAEALDEERHLLKQLGERGRFSATEAA